MRVIIDRFEGKFAIVELSDRRMATIPIELLPSATEGDVIDIIINSRKTSSRKKLIDEKFNRFKKAK